MYIAKVIRAARTALPFFITAREQPSLAPMKAQSHNGSRSTVIFGNRTATTHVYLHKKGGELTMALRFALRRATRRTARTFAPRGRRTMASGPAPINESGGWLFGHPPGHPKPAREGWERMTYWSLYGGSAFLIVCLCSAPNTSIKVWARAEAEGRNDPVDPSHEVTPARWFVHYIDSVFRFSFAHPAFCPTGRARRGERDAARHTCRTVF